MATCTIEADGPLNENLSFRPLQRSLRGKFDWQRCSDPEAMRLSIGYGGMPIPGQRIVYDDVAKSATIQEPLHDPEHAALAEKIKARGYRLPPAREYVEACDPDTWGFWLARAIECGLAKLLTGKLPAFDESKARRDFIFAPPKPGTNDKLADALNSLAQAQAAQTAVLSKLVTLLASK